MITKTSEDLLESKQSQHLSSLESTFKDMIDLNNRLLALSKLESSLLHYSSNFSSSSSNEITDSNMSDIQTALDKIMTNPSPTCDYYNTNSIYLDYKKRLWQFEHPEEEILSLPSSRKNNLSERKNTDIVATHGTIKSLTCPITQMTITDPVLNIKCNHSYDRHAILQLIANESGTCRCPVSGCSNTKVKESQLTVDDVLVKMLQNQKMRLFK